MKLFLTKEEKEQIDKILEQAERRMRQKMEHREFQLLECQMHQQKRFPYSLFSMDFPEMLMAFICEQCNAENCNYETEDVDFPFPTEKEESDKVKEAFQKGRMDMLYGMVAHNRVSLSYAAKLSHMNIHEAKDMLDGWREAHAED